MAEEIAFKNGRISNFQGLVTLILTLDQVTLHTITHHSTSSTYMPKFIEIEKTFVDGRTEGRTYVSTYVWTVGRTSETHFIKSNQKSRPNNITQIVLRTYV